jgi:hypothetical protein
LHWDIPRPGAPFLPGRSAGSPPVIPPSCGQEVDDAGGIWVDAGDAVGCAFTHTFTAPGSYALAARVRTDGGDWDEANNADTATLQVRAPEGESTAFTTDAVAEQFLWMDTTWSSESWRDLELGTAGERGDIYARGDWMGWAVMNGYLPRAITGPVYVQASQEVGGQTPFSGAWMQDVAGQDWCTDFYWALYVCSSSGPDGGSTTLQYIGISAMGVMYHGIQFGRAWDESTGVELYSYHYDYGEYQYGDPPVFLGDRYTWRVRLSAADGEFHAEQTLQLRSGRSEWRSPRECWTTEWPTFISTRCANTVSIMEWTRSD